MKRLEPRISVNKLGEYMVASASRRRTIRKDQKEPKTVKVIKYSDASNAILKFLGSETRDPAIIDDAIRRLRGKPTSGTFDEREKKLNLEALAYFQSLVGKIDLQKASQRSVFRRSDSIVIAGVRISLDPYLLFLAPGKKGAKSLGLVKLHFPKTNPLKEDSAAYVGAVLQRYCTETYASLGIPNCDLFQVIDVPSGQIFRGPKSTRKRLTDVEAACEEIAIAWNAN